VFKGKGKFKNLGDTLEIGQQRDGHLCGVYVINTIEHQIFDVLLFIPEVYDTLCVWYFVELVTRRS